MVTNKQLMEKLNKMEKKIDRDQYSIRLSLIALRDYSKEAYYFMLMSTGISISVAGGVVWIYQGNLSYLFITILGLVMACYGIYSKIKNYKKVKEFRRIIKPYAEELMNESIDDKIEEIMKE